MDDIQKGVCNRLNDKFLAKFVTNKSINLDSDIKIEKNHYKKQGEDLSSSNIEIRNKDIKFNI